MSRCCILPGSLALPPEQLFDQVCGFNKGYARTLWSTARPVSAVWELGTRGDGGVLFPFSVGLEGCDQGRGH